jgi:hypothetical protein
MEPLHLQGWNNDSSTLPSPLHILQVSGSPVPSSPPVECGAYRGSFMTSGGAERSMRRSVGEGAAIVGHDRQARGWRVSTPEVGRIKRQGLVIAGVVESSESVSA